MGYKSERTCKCIEDYNCMNSGNISTTLLEFHKGREYQVDVYPLWYIVYQNGGWDDYIHLEEDLFNKFFKLIE